MHSTEQMGREKHGQNLAGMYVHASLNVPTNIITITYILTVDHICNYYNVYIFT